MIEYLSELLRNNDVLLLFLVLGIGFVIGGIRIGTFQLGPVVGVLMAGLWLGNYGFEGNPTIQTLGFVLFIFSVGYQAGPKFMQAIKKDGRRYLVISIIVALSGFLLAYGSARLLGFDPGLSAGVLAGSLTSTPTLAAADAAVLSADFIAPEGFTAEQVRSNITTSYAITYIFGLVGLILVIRLFPGLMKIDLAEEAQKLELEAEKSTKQALFSPSDLIVRAFRIENEDITGVPLYELYDRSDFYFTIPKIKRNGELIQPTPDMELMKGDLVSVVGVLDERARKSPPTRVIGPQIPDRDLLQFTTESARISITKRRMVGKILGELMIPMKYASFVSKITRMGVAIDVTPHTKLEFGDVLDVTGPKAGLEVLSSQLGHLEIEIEKTDLSTFSWAIVIGLLVGTLSISILGVSIGLGSAGGLLGLGLLVGYLRSVFPVFGRMPAGAQWIFTEFGLLLFMAGVGLMGGAGLLETIQSKGLLLLGIGIVVTIVPFSLAYFWGRKVFKMNPLILLGAIIGSMTSGGALNVLNDQANSSVASLGYTGAYAFANILLTVAGALIILL
jgi:putative transport protein